MKKFITWLKSEFISNKKCLCGHDKIKHRGINKDVTFMYYPECECCREGYYIPNKYEE